MKLVCKSFARACEQLESTYSKLDRKQNSFGSESGDVAINRELRLADDQEVKFLGVVASVPGKVLEMALSITIELIVERLRRHR